MNPIQCQSKKNEWEAYDVGGQYYNLGDYTSYVFKLKKEYENGGCGKDTAMEKCQYLESHISNMTNAFDAKLQQGNITGASSFNTTLYLLKKEFNDLGCAKKIEEKKQVVLKNVLNTFSALDASRINENTTYERNKRIFFGASILLIGLSIFLTNKK
jgi:hypothetical protein